MPSLSDSVRAEVKGRLDRFESRHDVRVLYACESGSRAWGFASPDSDYDVRVVYVHPRDWYLSIDLERRDDAIDPEIEDASVGEIDIHAWDLRKALRLFRKSNPSLIEWLQSPLVYREDAAVMTRWRDLLLEYYRPKAAGYHYLSMARTNVDRYLRDADTVPLKKYLYVLRPLLAIRWIGADRGPVPVEFARLVDACVEDEDLRHAIDDLLEEKRAAGEMASAAPIPELQDFAFSELERLQNTDFAGRSSRAGIEPLNRLFRDVLDGSG
ncbi:nucleotidyltransferase domain-containing protein [Longibacter salinarum]|uniref:nucleotidyltransferase domain-containing protein n=1 Tax=Longibacter salinarum TaxID=1850348 RepID=UPI0015CF26DF|nr:nucleotidyltransferase domain-containing protein [Longibacter salinarum]